MKHKGSNKKSSVVPFLAGAALMYLFTSGRGTTTTRNAASVSNAVSQKPVVQEKASVSKPKATSTPKSQTSSKSSSGSTRVSSTPSTEKQDTSPKVNYTLSVDSQYSSLVCEAGRTINTLDMIKIDDGKNVWTNQNFTNSTFTVTADQNQIDLSKPGEVKVNYILTYTDEIGIEQEKQFERVYKISDKTAPTIMVAKADVYITEGNVYSPSNNVMYVRDNIDGEAKYVEKEAGYYAGYSWYTYTTDLNTNKPGTYNVYLKATDSSGNVSDETFRVIVNEKPVQPVVRSNTTTYSNNSNYTASTSASYIANTNTYKFHYTWCKSVNQMKEKNKWYYEGSRDYLISLGYVPCKNCNP
ncbi:MAG: hypothetical protein IJJ44_04270 [Solobacterium sp.]|nr:hypothetical protein [Solobacterium sp.]